MSFGVLVEAAYLAARSVTVSNDRSGKVRYAGLRTL
jgi:hypothetical protein